MLNAEWRSRPANNFFEFKKYSVLILDDHSSSQKIMTDVLRALGCRHIHRAATCNSAMAVLKAFTIDLLIADIALDGEDGLEFARRLRAHPDRKLARTPILIVSAFTTEAKVMEAGAAGVDGFLSKPISVGALAHRVSTALAPRASRELAL